MSERRTFGSILNEHRGDGPGFGLLRLLLAAIILVMHAHYLSKVFTPAVATAGAPHGPISWVGPIRPIYVAMVPAFFALSGYHWREYIPVSWGLFALSTFASYILLLGTHEIYLAPVFLSYFTLFLGVVGLPEIPWLRPRDYSYGIYLYGFPITQATIAALPILRGHAIPAAVLSVGGTMLFAALSWHWIEKPTLALKNRMPGFPFRRPLRGPQPAESGPTDLQSATVSTGP